MQHNRRVPNYVGHHADVRLEVAGQQHQRHGGGAEHAGHNRVLHVLPEGIGVTDHLDKVQNQQHRRDHTAAKANPFRVALQQISQRGKAERHTGDGEWNLFDHRLLLNKPRLAVGVGQAQLADDDLCHLAGAQTGEVDALRFELALAHIKLAGQDAAAD